MVCGPSRTSTLNRAGIYLVVSICSRSEKRPPRSWRSHTGALSPKDGAHSTDGQAATTGNTAAPLSDLSCAERCIFRALAPLGNSHNG
jgi:hypothetical protein